MHALDDVSLTIHDGEFVAVAEVTVGGSGAHPGPPGGLREGEAGRPLLGNQLHGGTHQRLAQIAVMVATRPFRPAHVNSSYMSCTAPSMAPVAVIRAEQGPLHPA